MRIVDLTPEHEQLYFRCLEDWSEEMDEAGDHKERWYRRMQDRRLRVKLAEDDKGTVGGMIQYLPIEYSEASGEDLYFVLCIWVHGYKQGRGNFQKRVKRATGEFGGRVIFQEYDTSDRTIYLEWGISDALFIDNRRVNTGPPPSYEKIKSRIAKQVKKLGKRG
ncbi:MAG: hypothetical protein ACP5IA_07625 [Sediminispirochaetaceae bacterium]